MKKCSLKKFRNIHLVRALDAAWFNGKEMFMKTAKNALKLAGLGLFTLMAAACNTVAGAGEDIQAGGSAIEDTADEVKEEMSN
jgi:predicted small secreted protein